MVFKDVDDAVWCVYAKEYNDSDNCYRDWYEFILKQNIGIVYEGSGLYTIVNTKKWVLARLKYEI